MASLVRIALRKLKDETDEIYLNRTIQTFALALFSIFVPIFLLKNDFSLNLAVGYILYMYLVFGIVSFYVGILQEKIGIKKCIMLSTPFLILHLLFFIFPFHFYAFTQLQKHLFVFFTGLTAGIYNALYWVSVNILFARHTGHNLGVKIGILTALPSFTAAIAPFFGGIIATLNARMLFLLSCILIVFSIVPFFFSKQNVIRGSAFYINKYILKKNLNLGLLYIVQGAFYASGWIWLIFIYTILHTYFSIGSAMSIVYLSSAVVSLFIGWLIDKHGNTNVFVFGCISNTALLIALFLLYEYFWFNAFLVFLFSVLLGLVAYPFDIPLFALSCRIAKHNASIMVFRELFLTVGRLFVLILAFVIPLHYVLFVSAFLFLLALLLTKNI